MLLTRDMIQITHNIMSTYKRETELQNINTIDTRILITKKKE
jgi:hypothetical protein